MEVVECLALKDLTSPRKTMRLDLDDDDVSGNEHKENICTEWRRSTPLKVDSTAPALLLARKTLTPDRVHVTPIKQHPDRGLHPPEPWTPTANLKMLISAASPDIRDREMMRKILFRPIENEKEKDPSPEKAVDVEEEDSCQFEAAEEEVEDDGERKPSRKQKSLGLLCHKFLALYPDYPPANDSIKISLDEVSTSLGVERRRIYDIVNVLESLMIVGRLAKNRYLWYGRQWLTGTLKDLHWRGRQQGYHLHMEQAAEGRESGTARAETPPGLATEDGGDGDPGSAAASNRKDKSLRIMSQKFVMLFLVSKTQTVTLDVAAKILIEESQDSSSHSKYKTKVRRLYDIANVLTSLSLIQKVHVREERGRKPAFQWIGPADFNTEDAVSSVSAVPEAANTLAQLTVARQPRLARHASFSTTLTASVAGQRQVNSAPCSPQRREVITGLLPHQPVDYSTRSTSSSTVCRLQFGSTTGTLQPGAGLQAPGLCGGPLLHSSSSSHFTIHPHHHLAYLPGLAQPSVVMLYGSHAVPAAAERLDHVPSRGQRSPASAPPREGGKRRREEEEDEERAVRRRESSEGCVKTSNEVQGENDTQRRPGGPATYKAPSGTLCGGEGGAGRSLPGDHLAAPPSHYLYVPSSAGLNNLNFLLSAAGQSPAGLTLPPGSMPTLALPYVLVPSSALSHHHYPLVANGHQPVGAEGHGLNFNLPAMMSPAHFVVGGAAGPRGVAEHGGSPAVQCPSTPEQTRLYGSAPVPPTHSPLGHRTLCAALTEPLTPQNPKEVPAAPGSNAFFQTPGALGRVVAAAPAARRRGSAQRRLDIGHPPAY